MESTTNNNEKPEKPSDQKVETGQRGHGFGHGFHRGFGHSGHRFGHGFGRGFGRFGFHHNRPRFFGHFFKGTLKCQKCGNELEKPKPK